MASAPDDRAHRPPPVIDDPDCGGDPPCWEGRIVDHRDEPAPASSEPDDA
jgi:hypothetical protein